MVFRRKNIDLIYFARSLYVFQQFETMRSFGDSIHTDKINIGEAEIDQSNLLKHRQKSEAKKRLKKRYF